MKAEMRRRWKVLLLFLLPLGFYFVAFQGKAYAVSNSLAVSGLCFLAAVCLWRAQMSGFFSLASYGFRKCKALFVGRQAGGEPYRWPEGRRFLWREEGGLLIAAAAFVILSFLTA